ncbi:hypothetical protein L596_003228 [Steinernema carpocapsae]|nr:hypothetical protein L596_003228 [Steinernema carpocapsae]
MSALLAGFFAACASAAAKLMFEDWESPLHRAPFLAAFVLSNVLMWWIHTKALKGSSSTLIVTLLNTGSNFLITALFGLLLFGESRTLNWYFGLLLILIGTSIVARSSEKPKID